MKIDVELWGFGDGVTREVEIADDWGSNDIDAILEQIFLYGQNDIQPRDMPSVSVGDVIKFRTRNYLIQSVGFKELSEEELMHYCEKNQADRLRFVYGFVS